VLRLEGKGIRAARQAGDLLVQVDVKIPTKLTAEQREILRSFAAAEGVAPKGKKWWNL